MRAVLAKSARPRIGRPHISGTPVRKTVFSPNRRKLTFCDAFTILLAPVLTAAFVADITQKDSRRQQWDRKIAEIQEEIDLLRKNESKRWNALQLRSVQAGAAHQRRAYSTAAAVAQTRDEDFEIDVGTCLVATDADLSAISDQVSDTSLLEPQSDFQLYENSLAVKVGLQLLLHIRIGRDPRGYLSMDGLEDSIFSTDSVDALLERLAHVNRHIRLLKEKVPHTTESVGTDTREKLLLDEKIASLTWQCRTGSISIPELIYGYTRAVMSSRTGPSIISYRRLVEMFSTLDADAMVFLAMDSLKNTKQVLNDHAMWTVIYQYGKTKEFGRLDKLLIQLTERRGTMRTVTDWQMVSVAGVRVPAPKNRRPILLDVLIRSALQNNQPHRARAWAMMLLQQNYHKGIARLFNNFLTYCSEHLDWASGRLWLSKTIVWAALFAKHSPEMLQALIFRMLDLCVSCKKHQYYELILNAAIEAGLEAPPEDLDRPDAFSDRARDIRSDWKAQFMNKQARARGSQQTAEAATIFQSQLVEQGLSVKDCIGITNIQTLLKLHGDTDDQILDRSTHLEMSSTKTQESGNVQHAPDSILNAASINARGFDSEDSALRARLEQSREANKLLQEKLDKEYKQNEIFCQELKELTARYSSALSKEKGTQKTLALLQKDHESIQKEYEDKLQEQTEDLRHMSQMVLKLQTQLQESKAEHKNYSIGSKSHEGHLKNILVIRENTKTAR